MSDCNVESIELRKGLFLSSFYRKIVIFMAIKGETVSKVFLMNAVYCIKYLVKRQL